MNIPAKLINKRVFVFLDSAKKAKNTHSYIFTDPIKVLKTKKYADIPKTLKSAEKYSKNYWISGYITYEASYALENGVKTLKRTSKTDLLWFGVFKKPIVFSKPVHFNTQKCPLSSFANIKENITKNNYASKIKQIKTFIKKGDTYQVNFTYNLDVSSSLEGFELYEFLRNNQPTSYCAYIKTESTTVMSFSPELFFETNKNSITVKPMKGTFEKGSTVKKIGKNTKESAENIMIVDLLRNDLGRICKTNTISVNKVFQIEKHPTISQVTTTISGQLKKNTGFYDTINSIFPSGSVTGAPKIRTMQIIQSLENGPRGVYCGAIGYISPGKKAVFNVPIRTLEKSNKNKNWNFKVGSGIVWDSVTEKEWIECRAKYRFLNESDFEIFESILWENGFIYLNEHSIRFKKSAKAFNFKFDNLSYKNVIKKIRNILRPKKVKSFKVRISLNKEGVFNFNCTQIKNTNMPALAEIEKIDTRKTGNFLFHKTTIKPWYIDAYKKIKNNKVFDLIYVNEKGELTEGARSNLFLDFKGTLYTPYLKCGLLPGVLRHILLRSKKAREKVLKVKDLFRADNIYMGNSVRGLIKVSVGLKNQNNIK